MGKQELDKPARLERGERVKNKEWMLYPIGQNKARIKIQETTKLRRFPLYCPKYKQEN